MGGAIIIVYEQDGLNFGPACEEDWRKAIANGDIIRTTVVIVYRNSEPPISQIAEEVSELRPLFEQFEALQADAGLGVTAWVKTVPAAPKKKKKKKKKKPETGADYNRAYWGDQGPRKGRVGAAIEEERRHRRLPAAVGIGAIILLGLGLPAAWILEVPARAPESDQRPTSYRVISTAPLRRAAIASADQVATVRRNTILKATSDRKTKGAWLRIAEGEDEGLFVWHGYVEPVYAGEDIDNMN